MDAPQHQINLPAGLKPRRDVRPEKRAPLSHTLSMQTGCPKCKTMVRANGQEWQILNASCAELAGTRWDRRPEYCPVLTVVAEPDVTLPGAAMRDNVRS